MCAAMKATGGAGFVLVFPVILMAFGKNRPELMLYCLLMTAVLTVTNSVIAPKDLAFSLAARGVYLVVGLVLTLQIVGQRNSRLMSPLLAILPYVAYMAIVSAVGWNPIISYLKIILFLIVFFAFYSATNALAARTGGRPECFRSVALSFVCFIAFGSLALIPFPGISKLGAAEAVEMGLDVSAIGLFKGITTQSQALGPMSAAMGCLLFADMLFSLRRPNRLYVILIGCFALLIYYTSSRTAMGTFLAGICFVAFLFMNASSERIGAVWKQRVLSSLAILGILGCVTVFSSPGTYQSVLRFVYKTGSNDVSVEQQSFEQLTSSRQGLIDNAMDNFRASPWIGNGFQVSHQMADRQIVSWKQLLSAPIEKGVWIYAVLEEGGIFGMILFLIFIVCAVGALARRQAYCGASLLVVILVSNLGEFCIFSMSGIGGVMWALLFVGLALDAQQQKLRMHQRVSLYL